MTASAWGDGLATVTESGRVLDVWFPAPALGGRPAGAAVPDALRALAGPDGRRRTDRRVVSVQVADLAAPPADTADAYLRLHLLSHRLVRPRGLSLDGVFRVLPNVVWTSAGPAAPEAFEETRLRLLADGPVTVLGVDKFPRMVDYVVPAGVRVADADRVLLGAHQGEGTTVMHEGFFNYSAGTLGTSMVEGRISAGVLVGDGSGVGGGASIMGTLSGGGSEVITVGERCLVGANAGIGISLGDDCVVAAGTYVTAGAKVTLPDGRVVKARRLSGQDGLMFWQNSVTGALEVVDRREGAGRSWTGLNADLHANV